MTKNLVTFLMIGMVSLNSVAQSVPIKKDEAAPFSGVLFSTDTANDLRKELLDKDLLKQENESLNKSINLYKTKDEISNNQIDELLKANSKLSTYIKNENSEYKPLLWFAIGIATSTLTVYALKKASN